MYIACVKVPYLADVLSSSSCLFERWARVCLTKLDSHCLHDVLPDCSVQEGGCMIYLAGCLAILMD